jgi:hypothetical protein
MKEFFSIAFLVMDIMSSQLRAFNFCAIFFKFVLKFLIRITYLFVKMSISIVTCMNLFLCGLYVYQLAISQDDHMMW